ncbi:glycoside hydrolase [Alicyclobacillaceae bacterium I2511]|nr:glycoside hydrolase [Alicyclobacillaceae bacterium I2511]
MGGCHMEQNRQNTVSSPSIAKTLGQAVSLIGACILFLLMVWGQGKWPLGAFSINNLTNAEIMELVGTSQYSPPAAFLENNLWSTLGQTLHIPFVNPVSMMQSQLPNLPFPISDSGAQGQTSLFAYLPAWQSQTHKIALGWIPYESPAQTIQLISANPGITVISPSWLTLTNQYGDVQSQVEQPVIDYAHNRHIQVWAMVNNQFNGTLTHSLLTSVTAKNNFIQQVAQIASHAHLNGINVDFENLQTQDRTLFSQFIGELHAVLKPLGVQVSVDVTPDIAFLQNDAAYFHAGLAANADYVIVMAYDEHWAADPQPGPVADVPWVTQSVNDLLNTGVPAGKLILGVPFYARFWHVYPDGSVSSQAVASYAVTSILTAHHAKSTWLPTLGVAYARYPRTNGYEEVWYETSNTEQQKLAMVNEDGLAGVAIWSLSLSNTHTWQTLMQAMSQSVL